MHFEQIAQCREKLIEILANAC